MAITAKDLKDLVRIVLLCIFWYVVGSSNGVLGKWILSEFPFPVTLTMVQVSIVCLSQNISYIGSNTTVLGYVAKILPYHCILELNINVCIQTPL